MGKVSLLSRHMEIMRVHLPSKFTHNGHVVRLPCLSIRPLDVTYQPSEFSKVRMILLQALRALSDGRLFKYLTMR